MASSSETTRILTSVSQGDHSEVDELMAVVYDELRALAERFLKRESRNHTLRPTALVHEAFLKLVRQKDCDWKGRSHFFAVGATMMRRILVDHAKTRGRKKRGGECHRIELKDELTISNRRDADVLAVDEALQELARLNPQQARIVELRFFAGMTVAEMATALGLSKRTVEREWSATRAWLRRELDKEQDR